MASRNLDDLRQDLRNRAHALLTRCKEENMEILIYCTLRSFEEQARLYCQSRAAEQIKAKADELSGRWGRKDLADMLLRIGPQAGGKVTNAGPGQSMHNYGLAFDAVPLRAGKPVWQSVKPEDKALWALYGKLGQEVGLEWAGNWTKFTEYPHLQAPGTEWTKLIKEGAPKG
jgi:peptidoglycan LD-endopeptidase CwlK